MLPLPNKILFFKVKMQSLVHILDCQNKQVYYILNKPQNYVQRNKFNFQEVKKLMQEDIMQIIRSLSKK